MVGEEKRGRGRRRTGRGIYTQPCSTSVGRAAIPFAPASIDVSHSAGSQPLVRRRIARPRAGRTSTHHESDCENTFEYWLMCRADAVLP